MYQRETAFTTTVQNSERTFVLRNTGVIRYDPKIRAGLAVVTVDGPQIGDATSGNVTRSKRGYAIAESAVNSDRPFTVDERTLKDALDAFVSKVAQRVAHPVRKVRYFVRSEPSPWLEVTKEGFVRAERVAGFHNTMGQPDEPGTSSFGSGALQGRQLYPSATADQYAWDPEFVAVAFGGSDG